MERQTETPPPDVSITFTRKQEAVLSCLDCITQDTEVPLHGVKLRLKDCTGTGLNTIAAAIENGLEAQYVEIYPYQDTGTLNESSRSRRAIRMTVLGKAAVEATPKPCSGSDPGRLQQERYLGCIACITDRGLIARSATVAECNGVEDKEARTQLLGLTNQGFVQREQKASSTARRSYHYWLSEKGRSQLQSEDALGTCDRGAPEVASTPVKAVSPHEERKQRFSKTVEMSDLKFFFGARNTSAVDYGFLRSQLDHPLLTAEDEMRFADIIKENQSPEAVDAAINALVSRSFRLILKRSREMSFDAIFIPLQDRIQAGALGATEAAKRFIPEKGRFSTYASYYIHRAIRDEVCQLFGANKATVSLVPKMYYDYMDFVEKHNDKPNGIQLAEHMGISLVTYSSVLALREQMQHFLSPRLEDYAYTGNNQVPIAANDNGHAQNSIGSVDSITALANSLRPVEYDILQTILGNGLPLEEIRDKYQMSRQALDKRRRAVRTLMRHPYFGILADLDDSFAWQDQALCRTNNNTFVVSTESSSDNPKICGQCSVRDECHSLATKAMPKASMGFWAGKRFRG